jgi:hypothetical protein
MHRTEYSTKPPSLTHPNCDNALIAQHTRQNNPKAAKPNAKAEATTCGSDRNESNPTQKHNKSPSPKEHQPKTTESHKSGQEAHLGKNQQCRR